MRRILTYVFILFLLLPMAAKAAEKGLIVKGVRSSTYAVFTRIVFEVEAAGPYVLTRSADGRSLLLSSYEGPFTIKAPLSLVRDSVIAGVEAHEEGGRMYAMIRLDAAAGGVKDFTLRSPDRIVIDIAKGALPVAPVQTGDRPLIIVLDPGHGGKDTGILTAEGLEKTFDLEVALAVRTLLQKNERYKVVMTRDKDQAVSLDERAAVANAAGASVFVSIHAAANATANIYIEDLSEESGVPDHPKSNDFLGFEAENEQQELIWGKQQAAHLQKSGELGRRMARQLGGNAAAEPVQAPLAELKAVDAPAVMIEISMARDRAQAAGEIARGVEQYVADSR